MDATYFETIIRETEGGREIYRPLTISHYKKEVKQAKNERRLWSNKFHSLTNTMNKNTTFRDLTEGERGRFMKFLIRENLQPFQSLYAKSFWEHYEANIIGMAYFSCPIVYPDYFEDGDLIRTVICADEYAEGEAFFPSVFWWFKLKRDGIFERLTPQTVPEISDGSLICICGNEQTKFGFYPCNQIGSEVDTEPEGWSRYACNNCGRIIDYDGLEVEGFRQPNYTRLK